MPGLLVHEWIESSGGAENVLEAMAKAFPDAGIQCLWNDAPTRFAGHRVRETWLARTPLRRHKAAALPLMLPTWRRLRADGEREWMLVSSHLFAHHARLPGRDVPKFVYAHTPARYIWNPELDERGDHLVVRAVSPVLRRIDRRRAQEATSVAANSAFVRDRIRRAWDRDATVIHPPVAVERIVAQADWRTEVVDDAERRLLDTLPETFVLGASRFVPYKRLDRVILAAAGLGIPVVIAGSGPDTAPILAAKAIAAARGVPARIVTAPSTALLYALMQRAAAFVFPAVEDFGIMPVEAQAAGTPVVTGPVGGQVETYTSGVSGVTARSAEPAALATAMERALALPPFDRRAVTARFSEDVFITRLHSFLPHA